MTEEELIKLKIQLAEDMREKALVSKVERQYKIKTEEGESLIKSKTWSI